jgi:predicted transposase/invertase (TIGR01784 family)
LYQNKEKTIEKKNKVCYNRKEEKMTKNNMIRDDAPLLNDYVFKRTFTKGEPNGILKDFLESILDMNLKNVEVLNSEIPKDILEEKGSVLDIRAKLDDERLIDIEMQVKDEGNIDKRSTIYMSKNISTQINTGEDYQNLKPSIVINILNFNRYKRNSYHLIAHMKFEESKKEEYVNLGYEKEDKIATDVLEMHFIELPKFIKKNPEIKTKLEEWLYLIIGREDKVKMSKLNNPEVQKAMKLVEEIMSDPKEREIIEARAMAKFNYDTGMAYAKRNGIKEGIKKRP